MPSYRCYPKTKNIAKLSKSSIITMPSYRCYRVGTLVVALVHEERRTVFIGSDSRETTVTHVKYSNGSFSSTTCITRQPNTAIYPGLDAEIIGKKIYACNEFIIAETGHAEFAETVCTNLINSTNTRIKNGERVTREFLCEEIMRQLEVTTNSEKASTKFLLVTPGGYFGASFTVTRVEKTGYYIDTDGIICIGTGPEIARDHIYPPSGTKKWLDKSVEGTRSIVRDGIYETAKVKNLMVGGPVVVYTWTVEEDGGGKEKLVRERVEFPPLRNVLTLLLRPADIRVGLHLKKEWCHTSVFSKWEPSAEKKLVESKESIEVCAKFYTEKIKHSNFYKRPKHEHPKSVKHHRMKLRIVKDVKDFYILGGLRIEDFRQFCKKHSIGPESTVGIFWEEETSAFNWWVEQ